MATGMYMDERSVHCLVLGHHDQDRKVSAKSVSMRAMTLCKNLSGYRELLLRWKHLIDFNFHQSYRQRYTMIPITTVRGPLQHGLHTEEENKD